MLSFHAAGVGALAATALTIGLFAQNSGGSLVVRVIPEAHLDTPVTLLSFHVSNPGEIAFSQIATITAWVRSLPGQQIILTAEPASLNGPAGVVPTSAIRWSGSLESATGGATAAICTSGDFSTGAPQQLIRNWAESGIAKCLVRFALTTGSDWPTGNYTGEIHMSLSAQ